MSAPGNAKRWMDAWPDGLAFAGGLALAWFGQWRTTDLVWSLWLSSLVVGYASIVWTLFADLREFIGNAWHDPTPGERVGKLAVGAILTALFLLGIVFYTVHFGAFHLVHSLFVNYFFPVQEGSARGFPTMTAYADVLRRYWVFVPLALLAERAAFRPKPAAPADAAVTPEAIARRKRAAWDAPLFAPYKNVIRLHLLIFFFAAAYFLHLATFVVYAVVYAVYFFPWRLVGKRAEAAA